MIKTLINFISSTVSLSLSLVPSNHKEVRLHAIEFTGDFVTWRVLTTCGLSVAVIANEKIRFKC